MRVKNRKCIRRLSFKSLWASRKRNIIAICAIALTTLMFTSLFTIMLSVTTELPEGKSMDKVTGNNIRLRNINFKPTAELLNEVARQVRFERSKYTTKSRRYTEEQLWDKIVAFIKVHDYICRRDMEYHFSLRQQTALKWLKHFTEKGLLVKKGARNAPLYFLAEDNKGNKDNEGNEDNGISLHTKRLEP